MTAMANTGLPVSRLVDVQVDLSPQAAQGSDFNTLLILGSSGVIDTIERMRDYATIGEVANDFGTSAPEYLAAVLWFEQNPQPNKLFIGQWAKTATSGQLRGGSLTPTQQLITNFTAITAGAFAIKVDGASAVQVTGLNFSGASNLNGVASLISTALASKGASCVWDGTYDRFIITSLTTGAASAVDFLAAPASGTNIIELLQCSAADTPSGAYTVPGIAAETAVAAVSLFDLQFNSKWYALTILGAADADHLAVAAYIEAANPAHYYGVSTMSAGVTIAATTNDIASLLSAGNYSKTCVQYSSTNPYSVCSYLARILTTNWDANNSTITLMYKQEPGIVPETINSNQADSINGKNCNVFVTYQNSTAIIQYGKSSSGDYTDTIIGLDWLAGEIQNVVYNLLYTSTTKIPQTDVGNNQIATVIEAALYAAVNNGLLAPGQWNSAGFGQLKQGDFLRKGFYVYAPPISSQSQADREARKSVPFQVAAKLAGAVHTVDVIVNVNR